MSDYLQCNKESIEQKGSKGSKVPKVEPCGTPKDRGREGFRMSSSPKKGLSWE